MRKVFSPFLLEIVLCDAQKHKYCIYKSLSVILMASLSLRLLSSWQFKSGI